MEGQNKQATDTATPAENPKKRFPKRWKPIHDRLLSLLLAGKTNKDAAEALELSEWYVSRLQRWPVFDRRLRQRRAAIVNASDTALMNSDMYATQVLMRCMARIVPTEVEVIAKGGETKKKILPADPELALSAAIKVKTLNREKVGHDPAAARLEALEDQIAKLQAENK